MDDNLGKQKTVKIVYYSGTGGTQRVTENFKKAFTEAGYRVCTQHLAVGALNEDTEYDLLLLVYAVHACNAPEPVYKWIESSKKMTDIPAVIISVSGGGEVTPNTACRLSCIRKLKKKGYQIVYEKMLVMPSNWIVQVPEPLALLILEVLPAKIHKIVSDISNNIVRRTKPKLIDRLLSRIGELEKFGARSFGKQIKVSDDCNGCGWCVKNCPAGNITSQLQSAQASTDSNSRSKPIFGGKCNLCLKCIYGCPNKALQPGFGKFIVIKEGYNLKELETKLPNLEQVDVESLTKGYIWSGVRKYLLDDYK